MDNNYLVLSRKWRPQCFNDVVGQFHVTRTLQNALSQNRLAHGYLFAGSRGVGKTSVARILSRTVNCLDSKDYNPCNKCVLCIDILKGSNFDVIELDGASNRGIDEIRDLRESVKYPPISGKYKVYIIDEVHMLTKEAFNALLKTLEEPPNHVLFILATTDPHKIPQTILSRTQRFNFKRISISEINDHLSKILNSEKKSFEDACLQLISKKADGSMRDALSLLDQVIAYCDDSIDIKNVSEAIGLIDNTIYSQILCFILQSDLSKTLSIVNESIGSGHSINDFIDGFIDFLNRYIHFRLNKNTDEQIFFDNDVKDFLQKIESELSMDFIIEILELTIRFQNKLKFVSQPMIALESHFIKLAYINKNSDLDINKDIINKQIQVIDIKKKNDLINKEESSNSLEKEKEIKSNPKDNKSNPENIQDDKSNNISIEYIKSKWNDVISNIEKEHPKTASFLNEVVISDFKDNKLNLIILNGSQFHINSLENDINIINEKFSIFFNQKINVYFKIEKNDNKSDSQNKPEQHPLISKAIDLLDGEII